MDVVSLSLGYGIFEITGGFIVDSHALKTDAFDFLGDDSITFLSCLQ